MANNENPPSQGKKKGQKEKKLIFCLTPTKTKKERYKMNTPHPHKTNRQITYQGKKKKAEQHDDVMVH